MKDFERLKQAVLKNEEFKKYSCFENYADIIARYLLNYSSDNIFSLLSSRKHPFYIVDSLLSKNKSFEQRKVISFNTLNELLSYPSEEKGITGIYFKDRRQKNVVDLMLSSCNGNFFSHAQQLPNLIGIHSNARIGTIKKATIGNISVIIKKNSARKPERFINEQKAIEHLYKLGITKRKLIIKKNASEHFFIKLLDYYALIKDFDSENCYSVSKEVKLPTVEEILIECTDYEIRQKILSDLVRLLDYFFKKGIFWHDIAPRNILVKQKKDGNEYTILDFERTKFQENVSREDIDNFFRESFCIEEFSVICTSKEITKHFKKFYNPQQWDIEDNTPIKLNSPKKDYLEILKRRGYSSPSQGDYDRFELENIKIRFPFTHLDEKIYPLHLSFKVNHFFDFYADLDVMELMMFSKKINYFYETLHYFDTYMKKIDELLFIEDFLKSTKQDTNEIINQRKSLESHFLKIVEKLKKKAAKGSDFIDFVKKAI